MKDGMLRVELPRDTVVWLEELMHSLVQQSNGGVSTVTMDRSDRLVAVEVNGACAAARL